MVDTAKDNLRIPLSAVVYLEGKHWIAHCLELDLVAEGADPKSAFRDLLDLSLLQIKTAQDEDDLESIFKPAPSEIWRLFWKALDKDFQIQPTSPVNRFETRELAFC